MIYFIGGIREREFKYFAVIQKIREEYPGISEHFYDVDIKEEEKFLEKVSFNSIFSERELVVLKRSEKIKDPEKMMDYLSNLDVKTKEIVIDYEREDGKIPIKLNKKLETLKKEGRMEVFLFLKESEGEIVKYIQKELDIPLNQTRKLIEMIGKNPIKIRNELEKIKVYLNGAPFNLEEVKNIVSVDKEYKIYEMTEAVFSGKGNEVLNYLEKTKEYMGILYSLYGELEMMYKLSTLKASGRNFSNSYNLFKGQFEDIKDVFKTNNRIPNPYVVFKKLEKIKNYSASNLEKLLFKCWKTDKDIKTGKITMEAGVENIIMKIAGYYKKYHKGE